MSSLSVRSAYLIAGASLLTMAVSAYGVTQEATHFTAAGFSEEARIAAFVTGERVPGLSSITQMSFMLDCRNAMVSDIGLALPADQRTGLYRACFTGARAIATSNPNSSLAWLCGAHAALALGDYATMNEFLTQSYRTGRNEGWVAKMRVELVELNFGKIAPALLPEHDYDLALTINGPDQEMIARIFVDHPASRERITRVADSLPDAAKRNFLGSVNRAVALRSTK